MQSPLFIGLAILLLVYQLQLAYHAIGEFTKADPKKVFTEVITPPPPTEIPIQLPHRLRWATRILLGIAISFVLGWLLSLIQLTFNNSRITGLERQIYFWLFFSVFIIPQLFLALRRGLLGAKRIAWVLSLGVFIVLLGTPLFPVGLIGMCGLIDTESRQYFWGNA